MKSTENLNQPLLQFETIYDLFITKWNNAKKEKELNGRIRILGSKEQRQIKVLLKAGYTTDQIIDAFKNAMNDDYHRSTNYKYLTPEFITRIDKFNRFINAENKPDIETGDYSYQ